MLHYQDGQDVRVGDSVRHAQAAARVESLVTGDEVADWGVEGPGFLIVCDQCGRVLIEIGSADWEDVCFVARMNL